MIIGLTGGMGCGKSTAAEIFGEMGFRRIDADAQVKSEILPRPAVIEAIAQRFGKSVLAADGSIDRTRLGERVFAQEDDRRWLEGLLHPLVFEGWRAQMRQDPAEPTVIEVPLLFEQSLENWFDFTVCVTTSSAAQLVRLEKRGVPRQAAMSRISKQMPLARKAELADYVLSNDGSREFLRTQIGRLIEQLS